MMELRRLYQKIIMINKNIISKKISFKTDLKKNDSVLKSTIENSNCLIIGG